MVSQQPYARKDGAMESLVIASFDAKWAQRYGKWVIEDELE